MTRDLSSNQPGNHRNSAPPDGVKVRPAQEDPTTKMKAEDVLLDVERHMPDGAGPVANERRVMAWMAGALALLGMGIVGGLLAASEGWRAGLIGVGWVVLAYGVAWIVVWAAGLMRADEEAKIENEIEPHVGTQRSERPAQDSRST